MTPATTTTKAKAVRQHGGGLVHATLPRAALRGRQQCPSGGVKKSLCCAAAGINALDLRASTALAYPMTGVRQAQKLSTPLRSPIRPPAQPVLRAKALTTLAGEIEQPMRTCELPEKVTCPSEYLHCWVVVVAILDHGYGAVGGNRIAGPHVAGPRKDCHRGRRTGFYLGLPEGSQLQMLGGVCDFLTEGKSPFTPLEQLTKSSSRTSTRRRGAYPLVFLILRSAHKNPINNMPGSNRRVDGVITHGHRISTNLAGGKLLNLPLQLIKLISNRLNLKRSGLFERATLLSALHTYPHEFSGSVEGIRMVSLKIVESTG